MHEGVLAERAPPAFLDRDEPQALDVRRRLPQRRGDGAALLRALARSLSPQPMAAAA
jgi:hypothetical protein